MTQAVFAKRASVAEKESRLVAVSPYLMVRRPANRGIVSQPLTVVSGGDAVLPRAARRSAEGHGSLRKGSHHGCGDGPECGMARARSAGKRHAPGPCHTGRFDASDDVTSASSASTQTYFGGADRSTPELFPTRTGKALVSVRRRISTIRKTQAGVAHQRSAAFVFGEKGEPKGTSELLT